MCSIFTKIFDSVNKSQSPDLALVEVAFLNFRLTDCRTWCFIFSLYSLKLANATVVSQKSNLYKQEFDFSQIKVGDGEKLTKCSGG